MDVIRASWVAEMLIEWNEEQDKEKKPFPLSSFTQGLFRGVGWSEYTDHHPMGGVAKLFSRFEKLKVAKDGLELSQRAGGS